MTQPIAYRQSPVTMPTLEMRAVLPLLPRLKCGECKGRIDLDPPTHKAGVLFCMWCAREYNLVVERIAVLRPLAPEEAHPKRGRPPKPTPAYTSKSRRPCVHCGAPSKRGRCADCYRAHLTRWTDLLPLLADGRPHRVRDLKAALGGISDESLRQFVRQARLAGHPIRSGLPFGTYRLGVTP